MDFLRSNLGTLLRELSQPAIFGRDHINIVCGRLFAFYVTIYFTVTDFDALIDTTFPAVIGALYLQVTKSAGITLALLLIVVIPAILGLMGYMSANIRLVYGNILRLKYPVMLS